MAQAELKDGDPVSSALGPPSCCVAPVPGLRHYTQAEPGVKNPTLHGLCTPPRTHLTATSPGHQLGHVGADQGPPVSALKVEFLEAQPQHQLVKDPGSSH